MIRILFVLFLLPCISTFAQDWVQLSDFPGTKRDDGVSFKIGDIAYFGTGLDESFTAQNNFFVFDLTTELWSSIQSLPEPEGRQYATASGFNDNGYVFGGISNGQFLNDLWKYNPLNDTWIELDSLPGEVRSGASNFILNNQWYIIGGKNSLDIELNEVWKYDFGTNVWSQVSNLPNWGVWKGMAFSYNNVGYAGLGQESNDTLNTYFWEYDFGADSWSLSSWSLTPRVYPVYAQVNEKVFVYGGEDSQGSFMNTFEAMDLGTNQLLDLGNFTSDARRGSMAVVSDDAFYLTTGLIPTARVSETWKVSNILSLETSKVHSFQVVQIGTEIRIINGEGINNFEMYSITGEKVSSGFRTNSLNVSNLAGGLYIYRIDVNDASFSGKIYVGK